MTPESRASEFVELENALARERQTQFELRRQLLAADESLDRLAAQCAELEACRDNVSQLVADATRISSEAGDPEALWALVAAISGMLAKGGRISNPDGADPLLLGQ